MRVRERVAVERRCEVAEDLGLGCCERGEVEETEACEADVQQGEDLVVGVGRGELDELGCCGDGGGVEVALFEEFGERSVCGWSVGAGEEWGGYCVWGDGVEVFWSEQRGEVFLGDVFDHVAWRW